MNSWKKFTALCCLVCLACNQIPLEPEDLSAFKNAQHLLASVRSGAVILGVEADDAAFTVDYSDQGKISYKFSDVPYGVAEDGFCVESLAGRFDYSSDDELLQVMTTSNSAYFFLSDGTVLSAAFENSRPTMLSVFDAERFLKKPGLKVLDIGNSYTDDALGMMDAIVKYQNIDLSDMCLYMLIRGGSSFRDWVANYEGHDPDICMMMHVVGDLPINCETGEGKLKDNGLIRSVLTDEKWDLIIIHQVSNHAPNYSRWNDDTSAGGLDEFLSILRSTQPQAAIGTLLVHSYMDRYEGNTEKSARTRWRHIADATRAFCSDYGIGYVIPYGTAVENLRANHRKNRYCLTRDGVHLGFGLARFTASCCYYEALLGPRTGTSVKGCGLRYYCPEDITVFKYPEGCVDVTDESAELAHKAAIRAVEENYNLTKLR